MLAKAAKTKEDAGLTLRQPQSAHWLESHRRPFFPLGAAKLGDSVLCIRGPHLVNQVLSVRPAAIVFMLPRASFVQVCTAEPLSSESATPSATEQIAPQTQRIAGSKGRSEMVHMVLEGHILGCRKFGLCTSRGCAGPFELPLQRALGRETSFLGTCISGHGARGVKLRLRGFSGFRVLKLLYGWQGFLS